MKKEHREKKTDSKKTISISFRTTPEIANTINDKAKQSGLKKCDYINDACRQRPIIVIEKGTEILQIIQDARNILRKLPANDSSGKINIQLGKVLRHLGKLTSEY